MAATLTLGSGLPVALGQIDRELKKLWEQSGGVATRASLINLALYCEGREAMADNTDLIARITQDHACRAILICAVPEAPESKVQAWISAHCHMSRAGAKQVCSEQITFLLEGPSRNLIPNIVFSHLDSDLPLYLWWQGEFPDPVDSQLWKWVDRLIFDSNEWSDPCGQLKLLRDSLCEGYGRLALCDLNWTRSLYFRQAISSIFDHPENLAYLNSVDQITIGHDPQHRSTAILLISWLAAQLGWSTTGTGTEQVVEFTTPYRLRVRVTLSETPGAPVSECTLVAGKASFRICLEPNSEFLHSRVNLPDGRQFASLLPAGKLGRATLINEELERGGTHQVYLRTLEVAEKLF